MVTLTKPGIEVEVWDEDLVLVSIELVKFLERVE